MKEPTLEELTDTIRKKCGLRPRDLIVPDAQLDRDLGITGDDGSELLEAIEERFGVTFTAASFDLQPNEFLFGPEASLPGLDDLLSMFGFRPPKVIRALTVGQLLEVIKAEREKASTN